MPTKYEKEKFRVGKDNDKRYKLSDTQKEIIRLAHKDGSSIRGLSREWKVSIRTIQFIVFPERAEKNRERMRNIDPEKRREYNRNKTRHMQTHRKHLKELYEWKTLGKFPGESKIQGETKDS